MDFIASLPVPYLSNNIYAFWIGLTYKYVSSSPNKYGEYSWLDNSPYDYQPTNPGDHYYQIPYKVNDTVCSVLIVDGFEWWILFQRHTFVNAKCSDNFMGAICKKSPAVMDKSRNLSDIGYSTTLEMKMDDEENWDFPIDYKSTINQKACIDPPKRAAKMIVMKDSTHYDLGRTKDPIGYRV
uniref:Uncharacterized protein n=1 Tax=Acrobeloides nanus TaxID=290746 RepID=A0A914E5F0_9BILA